MFRSNLINLALSLLIPKDSILIWINLALTILFKPSTIGTILFLIWLKNSNSKVCLTKIDLILILVLIYQLGIIIDVIINNLIHYNLDNYSVLNMCETNNTGENIPLLLLRNRENPDYARLIRYLSTNVAALLSRRPLTRAIGLTLANAGNILITIKADIASNEERANYWIDQYNFYTRNGRLRGGPDGTGPFERGTNPFEGVDNTNNVNEASETTANNNLGASETTANNIAEASETTSSEISKFMPNFDFIRDFLSPVEHSIPLDTLINVHFIMILGLFVLVIALILLTIYFYINLFILYNKDYFLNQVKNKYALMYVKYVVFKTRVDIAVIGITTLVVLAFIAYILHYLIIHPIIIS